MPAAIAITFFSAPPSSQPMTSRLVYTRKSPEWKTAWSWRATSSSSKAMTLAAA